MSSDILASVTRRQTQVYAKIHMQVDNMEQRELMYYEGVAQTEHFQFFTFDIFDLRQNDIITDLNNIDGVTGTNTQYRILSFPEPFPDDHMEFECSLLRGTA